MIKMPESLKVLILKHPGATIINFLDGTTGLGVNGRTIAVQKPCRDYFNSDLEYDRSIILPQEVWDYLTILPT